MSLDGHSAATASQSPLSSEDMADEGRRYWKAAIAHLAPGKREAAWEFYLDRLESSAAADTLGGVMLLLEAHLAFFDDLPERLARAARQIEATCRLPGPQSADGGPLPSVAKQGTSPAPRGPWPRLLVMGTSAAVGAVAACAALCVCQRLGAFPAAKLPAWVGHLPFVRPDAVRIEPWRDPKMHGEQGVVVIFDGVAHAERTANGGARIYLLSPVEEVRRDLQALRQGADRPPAHAP